jgi:hypothetical protein
MATGLGGSLPGAVTPPTYRPADRANHAARSDHRVQQRLHRSSRAQWQMFLGLSVRFGRLRRVPLQRDSCLWRPMGGNAQTPPLRRGSIGLMAILLGSLPHPMPDVHPHVRLANARKRIDNLLAESRARVDKILANRPASATSAHTDRLHRLIDVMDVQAVRDPRRDDATDAEVLGAATRLIETANESVAASQSETVRTPISRRPSLSLARPLA